jgi:alkylhydroperoxidase/carboxymuconolactone decarboxylase family protein YurZ
MKLRNDKMEKNISEEKTEILIAIGAATAANCIPCFEHLFEKAISSGVGLEEINRATDIAGQVKKGAHIALTNSINELTGLENTAVSPSGQLADRSCCG